MIHKSARAIVLSVLMAGLAWMGPAAATPLSEPLTVVVPYPPGGASDRAARIVADSLQKRLGVPVIVENKAGAGGRIAAQYVKGAAADKNMLILANPAIMIVAPMVFNELAYDADKDFQPVSMVTQYGFGVAVSAESKVTDMKELVSWAKANPGAFNIAVPATGSLPHFFGLMLGQQIGVEGEIVGYRGSAPVITDLIGGAVPVAIDTLDALASQHQGKRIRILATSGTEREAALPDVPTFQQAGVDLQATGWNAFFAAASMPRDRVERLGDAIKAVTADPSVQRTLQQNDLIPVSANAGETSQRIKSFRAQWEPVVKGSGFVVTK